MRAPIRRSARPAATAHSTRECISSGAQASSTERLLTGAGGGSHLAGQGVLDGRAQRMLDLDAPAGVAPLLADAVEHRHDEVVPGPDDAASLHGLGEDRRARGAVQGLRGARQATGRLRAAGHRHHASAAGPGLRLDIGRRDGRRQLGDGSQHGIVEIDIAGRTSRLGGRDAGDDEAAHVLEPGEVRGGVAAVRAGAVLGRPDPVAAVPGAQGRGRHAHPPGHRGHGETGALGGRHCLGIAGHAAIVGARGPGRDPRRPNAPKIIQLNYLTNL